MIGFARPSAEGFVSLYSGIFFATFEKTEFSSSGTFLSRVKILPSFANVTFSFNLCLSERRGLTVFDKFLLSATSYSFKFA